MNLAHFSLYDGSVVLRPTTVSDIARVIGFERDPENALFIRHWTAAQHEAGIAGPNVGHLVIRDSARNVDVGHVILIGLENTDRSVEFKRIAVVEKGRGYGRTAIRLIQRLVFEALRFHRLWLEVLTDNMRARGLYAAEGFVEEGIHREALRQDDVFRSLAVMSMIEHEYRAFDRSSHHPGKL